MVAAETLGLPVEAITVNIGDSKYPASTALPVAARRWVAFRPRLAAARWMLWTSFLPSVAPSLGVPADQFMAVGGHIQAKGDASKKLRGKKPAPSCR